MTIVKGERRSVCEREKERERERERRRVSATIANLTPEDEPLCFMPRNILGIVKRIIFSLLHVVKYAPLP